MKTSIWDALAIVLVLGIVLLLLVFGSIFANPTAPFNPFPPATQAPTLFIATYTPTSASLPPTWTPASNETSPQEATTPTRRATSTAAPTRTAFVLPSPTPNPVLSMPTLERPLLTGKCEVVEQTPKDDSTVQTGTEFTTAWTLKNTGDSAWDKGSSDVKFKSGTRMQKAGDLIDMPSTVSVGGTIIITITMKAPATPGYYLTAWSIVSGSNTLCTFYVEILADKQ
jgi:hypothetical protein